MVFAMLALLVSASVAPVPPKVGVLPVSGGAGLSAADREHLRTRSRAALLGPGLRVAVNDELAAAESCANATCRKRSLVAHGVSWWLTIDIGGHDRMYTVRTKLWSADADEAIAATEQQCAVCGRLELAELVAAQAWEMRRLLHETADEPSVLVVDARPASARVEIDATAGGRGHVRAEVAPGEHEIRVSAPGYASQTLTLSLKRGVTRSLSVVLQRTADPVQWHRPLAIGGLVLATASIGGGAALVAIDGRPVAQRCGPERPQNLDIDGDCRYVHRTLGAGIAMTAIGVGLASAAVTMLAIDISRRRSEDSPSRVQIELGPARVGLAGRF